jgi:arylsulfatase A-like enzyme
MTQIDRAPDGVASARPNVLFIAVDDLRCELGCYGCGHVVSPNIDKLASEGVVFERAYCQSGVCNPSRASLMTGLRPDTTRVWDLRTHFRDALPCVVTLPQQFGLHGYCTTAIGKIYHNDLPDPASWTEPKLYLDGYPYDPDAVYRDDGNVTFLEQRKTEITAEGNREKHIDPFGQWYLKAGAYEMPEVPDNAYYDGAQTDAALDKLGELVRGENPFFFGVGYYRPHLPFNVPKRYWDLYDREAIPLTDNNAPPTDVPHMAMNTLRELRGYRDFRDTRHPLDGSLNKDDARLLKHGYLASVSYVDAQVGRLLSRLHELGIADNTIVVLWGDNGYKLGDHGSWCKMTNFETDTRVPLIIRGPGLTGRRRQIVEFVDTYPSLCELAGVPAPSGLAGQSLVPMLKSDDVPGQGCAFSQFLRSGVWQDPDGRDYMGYTIRTEPFRYVEWVDWETGALAARELYDHRGNSDESENLAGRPEFAETVDELALRLHNVFAVWRGAGHRHAGTDS